MLDFYGQNLYLQGFVKVPPSIVLSVFFQFITAAKEGHSKGY